ncbi:hypothetical protein IU500_07535 [Nocardia terpenica]|uniref:DUF6879 family protein n=1 Tax=Nocardia terpenica TaxID=455432 RepID=UPI001892F763|nr:DUF6879 family protein [Nocardia terpenica]MBF6060628.1 hypothetical protein [Nocardia terpenica]MBF6103888.1 hypothetical protein [Nocardia terpenica]MBF6111738.1 hypothetical protein [Nocardia terpenica]MBF6118109.1 hypothetical protein [Nocardia terpenica]MBF6156497.1 hypothetical protein [Nocardia terpenica]
MQLHYGEDMARLFRADWRVAVHLELQDSYTTPEEDEPFRKFLAGEPDDFAWFSDWENLVRELTGNGRGMRRVRVVTVPHTDYTRWALTVAVRNVEAGEDVRYLPRHKIDPGLLSGDDWWIFDDDLVAFSVFTPAGAGAGLATTTDPAIVAHIRTVRDRVWSLAIPYAEYVTVPAER